MAIPISRIVSQDNSGTTTATYPASPTDGNTLLAVVLSNAAASSLTGWTTLSTIGFNGNSIFVKIYALIANSTPTSVVPGVSGGTILFTHIYEYKGLANIVILDKAVIASGSSTSLASGNLITTNPNDLLFAALGTSVAVTAPAYTNNLNLRLVDTRLFDADNIVTATGTYTTTASWTTTAACGIILLGLQGVPINQFNNFKFVSAGDGMSVSEKIR